MNKPSWKTLSSKTVYQGKYLTVKEDEITTPAGEKATFSWVERVPFSIIIPVDNDNQIFVVNQYRYIVKKESLELPMGYNDPGENPLIGAKRELQEEIGATAKNWQKIGEFSLAPGLTNQRAHVFTAHHLILGAPNQDATEDLQVLKLSEPEISRKIASGEIHDGPTIIAFHFFQISIATTKS